MAPRKIFWLGDSCIRRLEEAPEWAGLSGRGLPSENAGLNGERSQELLCRTRRMLAKGDAQLSPPPAAFVVCIGANDLMLEEPSSICNNISKLLRMLRAAFPRSALFVLELASCTAGCTCAFRTGGAAARASAATNGGRAAPMAGGSSEGLLCGRSRRGASGLCNPCQVAKTVSGVNEILRGLLAQPGEQRRLALGGKSGEKDILISQPTYGDHQWLDRRAHAHRSTRGATAKPRRARLLSNDVAADDGLRLLMM